MNGLDRAQERLWLAWACLTCPKPQGLSIPPHQPGDSPQPMSSSASLAYYWFQLVPSQRAGWGTPPVLSSHTWFTGADQARTQGSPACTSPLGSCSSGAAGKHPRLPGPVLSVPPLRVCLLSMLPRSYRYHVHFTEAQSEAARPGLTQLGLGRGSEGA